MNKKIIMGIIIFILLLTPVGYFITKTGWYENYRQAQFLAAVINNTKNLETYQDVYKRQQQTILERI